MRYTQIALVAGARLWANVLCGADHSTPAESLSQGLDLLGKGKFEAAILLLGKSGTETTTNPQALRFLAKAYEGTQEWLKAAECCEKLATFGLRDARETKQHAAFLRQFDELSFETFSGVSAEQEGVFLTIARDPYQHGLVRFAAYTRLGQHCFSAGRLGEAERWYGLVAKGPKAFRTGRYLSDYATILRRRGKFKEAVALLRELEKRPTAPILGARPSLARTYGEWARHYLKEKNTGGAETMFRAARRYVPGAYLWEWLDVCQRRAKFAAAVSALEGALAQAADHEGPWLGCDPRPEPNVLTKRLASTYLTWAEYEKRRRRYDRVADLYAKAKQIDPTATPGLSVELIAKERGQAAAELLDRAIELMGIGRRYGEALIQLQAIALNFPDTPQAGEAQFHMAHCQRVLGHSDRALKRLAAFVKDHPDHKLVPQARLLRIYLLADRGRQAKRAVQECAELLRSHPDSPQAAEACYLRGLYCALMLDDRAMARSCFYDTETYYPDTVWAKRWAPQRIRDLE